MSSYEPRELADRATAYLLERHSPTGNRVGWMMLASIFVEAWDLYSISFLLVFLNALYHPSSLLLGLTSAGTQAGAILGKERGRRALFNRDPLPRS